MAATAPTSPPPASSGDASVAVFLDTDLGSHLAMVVAADSTIRHLKSQVAFEHAASFPDLGPIAVKSLQVRRKGALYHLSDSMLVRSAFEGVKGGRFLHVEAVGAAVRCSRDAAATEDGRRLGEGHLGVCAEWRAKELPAEMSEVGSEVLPHGKNRGLQGDEDNAALNSIGATEAVPSDVLPSSSSQLDKARQEIEAANLASDAQPVADTIVDKEKADNAVKERRNLTVGANVKSTSDVVANEDNSTKQSDIAQAEEGRQARKEELLHGDGGYEEGAGAAGKKEKVRKSKDISEDIDAVGNLSQEKKHKKVGSFEMPAVGEKNECQNREDVTKSDPVPMETNTSTGELPNNSFQREISSSVQQGDSVFLGNPSTDGKKKKRERRQTESSREAGPNQEMTKSCPGVEDLADCMRNAAAVEDGQGLGEDHLGVHAASCAGEIPPAVVSEVMGEVPPHRLQGDGADNAALTSTDATEAVPYDVSFSSQLDKERQETEPAGLASDAQPNTDLVIDQGKADHVQKEHRDPTVGDNVNSTSELVANEEKSMKQSGISQAEEERHARNEEFLHGDRSHEEGAVVASKKEKVSKRKDISEEIHAVDDLSQEKKKKKHKKAKKLGSFDMPAADPVREKNESENIEDVTKSDRVSMQDELVNDSFQREIPSNVQQGDSVLMENPSVDGKRKKKKRRQSESSKEAGPTQEVTKSSPGVVTNDNSLRNTNAVTFDEKQVTSSTPEEATIKGHNKLNKDSNVVTTNIIDEVLADLSSTETVKKDLGVDMSREQTHLSSKVPSAENVPALDGKSRDNAGFKEALPPKYSKEIDSEVPISAHGHKKSKGKQSKVLSTKLGSSQSLGDVTEENARADFKESDALRGSNKTSDLRDVLNSDLVVQTDDNTKVPKRQRKRSSGKHLLSDNRGDIGSQGEQANQVAKDISEGTDGIKAAVVEGDSVVAGPASPVGKVHRKTKKSSKTQLLNQTSTVQGIFHSSNEEDKQNSKNSCNEYIVDIGRIHDNETAVVATTQASVVEGAAAAVKSASPNAKLQRRKKSSKTELQMQDSVSQQGSDADLVNYKNEQEIGNPKSFADAVEPNDPLAVHLDSDKINFVDYFGPSKVDGSSVSAENTRSTEGETVKQVKEKKKSKRKSDMQPQPPADLVKPAAEQEMLHNEHQYTDAGNHDLLDSMVQKGRMKRNSKKEHKERVMKNNSVPRQEPEDSTLDSTLEKKLQECKSDADYQASLPIEESNSDPDYRASLPIHKQSTHASKVEQRKSTSQPNAHHDSRHTGGSIGSRRADPNHEAENDLAKSFSMDPASSDSTEDTPYQVNRYRVAVRKVPRKMLEKTIDKSKKKSSKVSTGAIFTDAISEGSDDGLDTINEKTALETSSDNSSTSADSGGDLNEIESQGIGISSAASDRKENVLDDDGTMSLSQRRLHISSILRSSSSYKKAKLKRTKPQLEDPESEPVIVFETEPDA